MFCGTFPSFFQKKRSPSSRQPRSTFHQMLWHSSAQCHRAPGFGEPLACSKARSSPTRSEAARLLLETQPKHLSCFTARTKAGCKQLRASKSVQPTCRRWGAARRCSGSTSPTLTCPFCLSRSQQQLFQFTVVPTPMAQQGPPIPYRTTEDTQTFWLTGQPVRS